MPIVVDPPIQTFTSGVQASLLPWGDYGSDWQNINAAFAAMFEDVYDIVADQGSPDVPASYTAGWSTLLNVETCPSNFLPYLGQFCGVYVPPGTDDADARALIRAESGFQRGTPASIFAAAQRNLVGTQSCTLLERAGNSGADPYSFQIVVRPEELPSAVALINAVNAVKPAGLIWQLIQADGTTWNEATHTWSAETADWNQASAIDP